MTQPGGNLYTQGFGSRPENVEVPHIDVRNPTVTDINYPIGKAWVNKLDNFAFTLTSITSFAGQTSAVWTQTGGSSGAISAVVGTANEISVSTVANVATVSLPAAIVAPGSLTTTTSLTADTTVTATTGMSVTAGGISATDNSPGATNTISVLNSSAVAASTAGFITNVNGQFDAYSQLIQTGIQQWRLGLSGVDAHYHISTTGAFAGTDPFILQSTVLTLNCNLNLVAANSKLFVNALTPASASVGQATLVSGTVTVSTTNVNPASLIFLTRAGIGTTGANTLGLLSVGTIVASTSFVINALQLGNATVVQATDDSVVNYWIIN